VVLAALPPGLCQCLTRLVPMPTLVSGPVRPEASEGPLTGAA
jgi:hypothetical protein